MVCLVGGVHIGNTPHRRRVRHEESFGLITFNRDPQLCDGILDARGW